MKDFFCGTASSYLLSLALVFPSLFQCAQAQDALYHMNRAIALAGDGPGIHVQRRGLA